MSKNNNKVKNYLCAHEIQLNEALFEVVSNKKVEKIEYV